MAHRRSFYIFLTGLGVFVFLLSVVFVERVFAYSFNSDNIEYDFIGLKKILSSPPEACTDRDTCPGLCHCAARVSINVATTSMFFGIDIKTVSNNYIWDFYNEYTDFTIMAKMYTTDPPGSKTYTFKPLWRNILNFNKNSCGITTYTAGLTYPSDKQSFQAEADSFMPVKECKYLPPFCCCQTDPKTGKNTVCRRWVEFDKQKNYAPSCGILGNSWKPLDEPAKDEHSGGCQALVGKKEEVEPVRPIDPSNTEQGLLSNAATSLNPAKFKEPTQLVARAIKLLAAFIGSIVFVLYIYAGLLWMFAGGNSEQMDKAKKILIYTTAGAAGIIGAYFLVDLVFTSLGV